MSATIRCKSKMKDAKMIAEAIVKVCENVKDQVTSSESQVRLSARAFSGYRDILWSQKTDKTFEASYDVDDTAKIRKMSKQDNFFQVVEQWYSALVTAETLKTQGFFPVVKQDGDRLRVLAQA